MFITFHLTSSTLKHILSISVNNSSGVLSHVAGLFTRRGYNIDSLSVGESDDPKVSVITMVVNEESKVLHQVKKQLLKLVDVIGIVDLTGENSIKRELILLTVCINPKNRNEISNLVDAFQGRVLDITDDSMMIELYGTPRQVTSFLKTFSEYGVKALSRTGTIALQYPSIQSG